MTSATGVLQRKTRTVADLTEAGNPARVLARAMRQAADRTARLDLTVTESRVGELDLSAMLDEIEENHLLIRLTRDETTVGAAVVDADLRAALVEMQTLGILMKRPAGPRSPSGTDAAMTGPALALFLDGVVSAAHDTVIEGWCDGLRIGARFTGRKAIEMALPQGGCRRIDVACDLGQTERTGHLRIILPHMKQDEAPLEQSEDWAKRWGETVQTVATHLEAVLHQMPVPLSQLENLQPGDVLPLSGASVTSLRLVSDDGCVVARGRLGQMSGHRAMRIEEPPQADMQAIDPPREIDPPDAGMVIDAD